jgi:hypothetical protein
VTKLRHRRRILAMTGPALMVAAVAVFLWIVVAQPGLRSSPVEPVSPLPVPSETAPAGRCSFLIKSLRDSCGQGELRAGPWNTTIRGAGDEVGITVTLPAGWTEGEPGVRAGAGFGLRASDGSAGMVVAVDPMGVRCGPQGLCRYVLVTDGGFSSWLWANPAVDGYSNEDVVVAGYDATQYDLAPLDRTPEGSCGPVDGCEALVASYYPPGTQGGSASPIAGVTQAASRIVAFEVPYSQAQNGSSSLVIWLWSDDPTDDVSDAVADVQRIVDGMSIQVPKVGESQLPSEGGN